MAAKIGVWRVLPLRKKQPKRCLMNWPKSPFPIPLCSSGTGGRENGSEVESRKKGGVGGRCFKNLIYFLLPYSDLIGNKLIHFPHDGNGWMASPCPYLDPQAFCCIFHSLSNWGEWQSAFGGLHVKYFINQIDFHSKCYTVRTNLKGCFHQGSHKCFCVFLFTY